MFNHKAPLNHRQRIFTTPQFKKLVANHKARMASFSTGETPDNIPVVKLFGGAACTWLLSELDPETGIAFGLCDLGMGEPEFGYIDVAEIVAIRFPPFNSRCERDLYFKPTQPMSYYAKKAREERMILV